MTLNVRTIILAALPLAVVACGTEHAPAAGPAAAPIDAATVAVARSSRPTLVEAGGVLGSRTTALVSARIVADVEAVLVAPGDHVRRGQPLVRLDDRDLRAATARAEAGAQAAEHASAAADAGLVAARAALALAETSHGRIAKLETGKAATAQELDEATAALAGARARVTAAEAQVASARAAAESARAAARAAAVQGSFSAVTAPFDGIVTERLVDPGNQVAPGVPLVRIEDGQPRLEVTLDASRASGIALGDAVEITIDGQPTPAAGTVAELARAADVLTQAVRVKVDLPAGAGVSSGRFATAHFTVGQRDVLAVPERSLRRTGQVSQVFVADNGVARLRLVSVGSTADGLTEVLAGLAGGERVLADPPPGLVDGTPLAQGGR
ncbi:MAG: efflux RND transporter periplasmic adaptor subunit [Vicinamibacterales bacterium]